MPAQLRGRYEALEEIGRGASGRVFSALRRPSGDRVAIKVFEIERDGVRSVEAEAHFRREARLLERLDHPAVARLLEWGLDADAAYLVMAQVPGVTLAECGDKGALPPSRVNRIGCAVASALVHIHAVGIVHRDLRPQNIVVQAEGEEPAASVIDFGLSREISQLTVGGGAGAIDVYRAPEETGALERVPDPRTDLYTLGVILYELLTGRAPFRAVNARRLVYLQLAARPPSIAHLAPDTSPALCAIVSKLLAKDPDDRYQSASSLLHDLATQDRLDAAYTETGAAALDQAGGRSPRRDVPLVGRSAEVASVRRLVDAICAGQGRLLFLVAPIGAGKRRLLLAAREHALLRDVQVLSADVQGSGPLLFSPVLRAMRRHLAALRARSADRADAVRRGWIRRLAGWADDLLARLQLTEGAGASLPAPFPSTGEDGAELPRSVEGVARALEVLAEEEGAVLLLVDELQLADEGTVLLLERLARRRHCGSIGVVAAISPGTDGAAEELLSASGWEVGGATSSQTLRGLEIVSIGPLSTVHARELCAALLAPLGIPSTELQDQIARAGRGWPGRIAAEVHARFERAQLQVRQVGDQRRVVVVAPPVGSPQEGSSSPGGASEYEPSCIARLRQCAGSAGLAQLAPLALLRRAFPFGLAQAVTQLSPDALILRLEQAAGAGALSRDSLVATYLFPSEVARAALARHLEEPEARVYERAAAYVEGLDPADAERLDLEAGTYLLAAGLLRRAAPHLVREGEIALGARAFRVATARFGAALQTEAGKAGVPLPGSRLPLDLERRARTGLAAAHLGLGRSQEAVRELELVLKVLGDPVAQARVRIALGSAWLRLGDSVAARRHLEAALPLLDSPPLPQLRLGVLLRIGTYALRRLLGRRGVRWRSRALPALPATDATRLSLARELEYALFFVDAERGIAVHLWGLDLAERFADSPALGYLLATHAVAYGMLGRFASADQVATRALAVGRAVEDDRVVAESRKLLGMIRFWQGAYEGCQAVLGQAEETFERLYDPFSLNVVWTYQGLAAVRQGELEVARGRFAAIRRVARETRDARGMGISRYGEALVVWHRAGARAALSSAEQAVEIFEAQRDTLFLGTSLMLLGELRLDLAGSLSGLRGARGDQIDRGPLEHAAAAVATLERSELHFRQHHLAGTFLLEARSALAEARAVEAELDETRSPPQRRRALGHARRTARRAYAGAGRFPHARVRAQRALGRIELLRDRPRHALRWLRASRDTACALGESPDAARAALEIAGILAPRSAVLAARELELAARLARWDNPVDASYGLRWRSPERGQLSGGFPRRRSGSDDGSGSSPRVSSDQHQRKLEAVIDVGKTLIGESDGARLLGSIVETAMEVTGAERGVLLLLEEAGSGPPRLVPRLGRATGEAGPVEVDPAEIEVSPAVLRFISEALEPVVLKDAGADARLDDGGQDGRVPALRSIACVPLRTDQTDLGRLYLESRSIRGLFSEQDLALLATFAAQAALAIETRRSRAALEAKARELQASRAELVQSAKMSAVGELAAGISHEIRNPLNIIGGATYMLGELLQPPPHPKIPGYLTSIRAEVDRAAGLIQNLLGFARPAESPGEAVSLNAVAERAVGLLSELAKKQGIEIVRAFCSSVPTAVVNASELQQVVVNLVINAMHALEGSTEGTITIHTRREATDCVLEVEDTGPGVPPELGDRIFEPFVTGRQDGTGLGLYVCYRIVERYGGRLTLSQEPDHGARFTIRLPSA